MPLLRLRPRDLEEVLAVPLTEDLVASAGEVLVVRSDGSVAVYKQDEIDKHFVSVSIKKAVEEQPMRKTRNPSYLLARAKGSAKTRALGVFFDLHTNVDNGWLTVEEVASLLGAKEVSNSLRAALSLMKGEGFLERAGDKYSITLAGRKFLRAVAVHPKSA